MSCCCCKCCCKNQQVGTLYGLTEDQISILKNVYIREVSHAQFIADCGDYISFVGKLRVWALKRGYIE